jgi:hypothetical protein
MHCLTNTTAKIDIPFNKKITFGDSIPLRITGKTLIGTPHDITN